MYHNIYNNIIIRIYMYVIIIYICTNKNTVFLQYPVLNGGELSLEMTLYDNERRQFDNFSSLHWTWSSSDIKLLPLTPHTTSNIKHEGRRGELY